MASASLGRAAALGAVLLIALGWPPPGSPVAGGAEAAALQLQFYTPVWISASWLGGATGPAIDRKDRLPETPAEWKRQLCPPAKVILKKSTASLAIVNSCPDFMTFYVCASKGSAQPPDELEACAQDPFDTPVSRFKVVTLDPGPEGDFFNVTLNLSIQLFYCSAETVLVGPPAIAGDPTSRAKIACLGGPPLGRHARHDAPLPMLARRVR